MLGCRMAASLLLQLTWEVFFQPGSPGWPGVLQIIAIRPRGGQAAAGVRMGMNYGCASLLGEQRAPPATEMMPFAPQTSQKHSTGQADAMAE